MLLLRFCFGLMVDVLSLSLKRTQNTRNYSCKSMEEMMEELNSLWTTVHCFLAIDTGANVRSINRNGYLGNDPI